MPIFAPFLTFFRDASAAESLEHHQDYPQDPSGFVFRLRSALLRGAAPLEGLSLRSIPYLATWISKVAPIPPKFAPVAPNFPQFPPNFVIIR